ncbi:MAG: carbonic anhydrase [Bdellovibrionota bacterium]
MKRLPTRRHRSSLLRSMVAVRPPDERAQKISAVALAVVAGLAALIYSRPSFASDQHAPPAADPHHSTGASPPSADSHAKAPPVAPAPSVGAHDDSHAGGPPPATLPAGQVESRGAAHDSAHGDKPVAATVPSQAPHGKKSKKLTKYSPGVSHNEPAHNRAPTAVDALASDQALGWLKEGNARYVSGKTKGPARDLATRQELAKGQHPYAIVLSCSDSRVPPELIFDQGFGQLFVVRVAGNVVGAATVASIEYAAEHLGSKLLVVMGHESCGAVKAAMDTPPTKSAGSMDLDTLVSAIRPNIESYRKLASSSTDPEAKTLRTPVKMNVNGVAARLLKRSKILRHLVHTGKLKVVGGVYGLASGEVEFWKAD